MLSRGFGKLSRASGSFKRVLTPLAGIPKASKGFGEALRAFESAPGAFERVSKAQKALKRLLTTLEGSPKPPKGFGEAQKASRASGKLQKGLERQ